MVKNYYYHGIWCVDSNWSTKKTMHYELTSAQFTDTYIKRYISYCVAVEISYVQRISILLSPWGLGKQGNNRHVSCQS